MSAALPSPRELLTSLITSLSSIPIPIPNAVPTNDVQQQQQQQQRNYHNNAATAAAAVTNPLKLIPPSHRSLLTTLHVLYPSTLLPALDLLDRRLVTRVVLLNKSGESRVDERQHENEHLNDADEEMMVQEENDKITTSSPLPPSAHSSTPSPAPTPAAEVPALYHLVRSAQPQSKRRHHGSASAGVGVGGQMYVVRLASWNCSCAAFAFSAFPALSSTSSSTFTYLPTSTSLPSSTLPPPDNIPPSSTLPVSHAANEDRSIFETDGKETEPGKVKEREKAKKWEFGGLSTDGLSINNGNGINNGIGINIGSEGGVPCCKHLLACVLAERWPTVLGGYMEEKIVSREEAAGLVCDL